MCHSHLYLNGRLLQALQLVKATPLRGTSYILSHRDPLKCRFSVQDGEPNVTCEGNHDTENEHLLRVRELMPRHLYVA